MTDQEKAEMQGYRDAAHKNQVGWDAEIQARKDDAAKFQAAIAKMGADAAEAMQAQAKANATALLREKHRVDMMELAAKHAAEAAQVQG